LTTHELSSIMLYVHPPLASAAYVFIFLFAAYQLLNNRRKRFIGYVGLTSWVLTFSGLVSGMIWAQIGWATYWSWDPKEDATLLLFIAVTFSFLMFFEGNKYSKAAAVLACILSALTILVSFIALGSHSFI
jgi:ABC-type transport system involved in cytochrome c biogenesis permease subunit